MNICEMRLRPQAIKAKLCCTLKVEMNEDEITSNIVMKVSFNHLRLAGFSGCWCWLLLLCPTSINVDLI